MRKQLNNGNERKNSVYWRRSGTNGPRSGSSSHRSCGCWRYCSHHAEVPPTTRLRRLLPTAWAMIRPYWSSEDRWAAWGLLLVVVALTLGMVYISVLFQSVEQHVLHRSAGQESIQSFSSS